MDLSYTAEEIAFREEVRAFFRQALPADLRKKMELEQRLTKDELIRWHRILDAKGWAAPMWPAEDGGTGWNATQQYIFKEEMQRAPAPEPLGQNINLVGPVICAFGTPAQKAFFLPKLRSLDIWFCQGFSEPNAGSDLASLAMRAVRDGDDYLISGQKVWTSRAHFSEWMFGLVRTDPEAKKQKGITYLLIDMKTPGVTVRPIITLDSDHYTNEVFFENVRVPIANRIGEENRGWDYAKFLLANERVGVARVGVTKNRIAKAKSLAREVEIAGGRLADDAKFRERLASIEVELKALEITNMRVVADMQKSGGTRADPKASVLKLKGSELQQAATELLMEIAGPAAHPYSREAIQGEAGEFIGPEWAGASAPNYFFSRAYSIYGGTSEVQRNIVAKNILGL
jgi:alkylation response protein AidB-like acyl-CoA dehydrogenase